MKRRILLSQAHVGDRERELLLDALDSGWVAPLGPHVDGFEADLANVVGDGTGETFHVAALSSGTAALHLSLLLAGVSPGDEVVCSTFTFAAAANAIAYAGASPVFLDSDAANWNLDPDLLEQELDDCAARNRLPAAVIVVDLFGQCADYARIEPICERHSVPLIEDAAEALGARYRDRPAGSFGRFAALSFNGNKIITTSGGGALVSRDADAITRARFLATQAREPAPHYQHEAVGYNYRLSNLLAAVGRAQLESLDDRVARRRAIRDQYRAGLADLPGIAFMPEPDDCRSTAWLTCICIDPDEFGATREQVRRSLDEQQIEARPLWKPMHQQPVWAAARSRLTGVSDHLFATGLCLPSGSGLRDDDIATTVDAIRGCCPHVSH